MVALSVTLATVLQPSGYQPEVNALGVDVATMEQCRLAYHWSIRTEKEQVAGVFKVLVYYLQSKSTMGRLSWGIMAASCSSSLWYERQAGVLTKCTLDGSRAMFHG